MNSSDQAPPSPRTGAHRAHGRTHQEEEAPRPFRHEPYLDGLFTYCLSVLCDHDTATDVLGDVLAVAERHPGRCPDEGDRRAWLYALARWGCLRRLAEQRRVRPGAHSAKRAPEHNGRECALGGAADDCTAAEARRRLDVSAYRRTELARLAWPEAAGTTPAQREALELAVRHRLGVPELAAVLGTPPAAARELLTGAACEVERTRAALAVVETGGCPSVSQLTGGDADGNGNGGDVLLSGTLRTELVRHVDDCPRCRRVAERVGAAAPWPGSGGVNTAALPLVPAPRTAVHAAMLRSGRGRGPGPRFDRTGFPMDPRDRAARRDRLRARAVTTTVVATVVAAPVLALWASYRGEQGTGESVGTGSTRISASETELPTVRVGGHPLTAYENTGNATGTTPIPGFAESGDSADVSVEVISTGPPATPAQAGTPGSLSVAASSRGALTLLTLTASGGARVDWRLWSDAPWLRASRTAGTLAPGESVTLHIAVDSEAQPVGAWTARVGVDPGGAVVSIRGRGRPASTPTAPPEPTQPASPSPTPEQTPEPTPTPSPTEPTSPPPSPTPAPSPTDGTGGTAPPAPDPDPTGPGGG
ncbi:MULTISPECIES: BACON domain-containing protein [unclassified Streptomyces]|uniref:BACON domain-containing protein n=1 Tax=unclassified Streptomyces TaxID=2593676 RepID=UPI0005ECEC04|nr:MULTISPECIES: sigma-70 family RNA polymerase sigma factor [unclassified Streptomyces]APU40987.1 hypothetical protein BSL84_15720 [Streptomyces sp. TN58]KJK44524.1 alanine-rich protein [Streptomyces sp. NRRL F-4428]